MSVYLRYLIILLVLIPLNLSAQPKDIESYRPANFPMPPKNQHRMFFLQRNLNFDTVIYDLNYQSNKNLNADNPLDVFYLRYTSEGQRAELNWIERQFAYGYEAKPIKGTEDFEISLNAYGKRKIQLRKQENQYVPIIKINNRLAILTNLFVQADETAFWPSVQFIELFGEDLITGKVLFEKFQP